MRVVGHTSVRANFDKVAHLLFASEDLSLNALAEKFGYSREHLSRLLHGALQESWNGYIGRLRAKNTHALLTASPELSVLEAAFACGFESSNTFYRAYAKEYGHPPKRK